MLATLDHALCVINVKGKLAFVDRILDICHPIACNGIFELQDIVGLSGANRVEIAILDLFHHLLVLVVHLMLLFLVLVRSASHMG